MEQIQLLLDWLTRHPNLAVMLVFFACAADTFLVIGVLIPGMLFVVGAGALVALGAIEFWPAVIAAAAGAVVGDSITYWLGHHLGRRLFESRMAHKYADVVSSGQRFFKKYGNLSVFMGRYLSPLRPVVPAIAGAYGMTVPRFLAVASVAGFTWSLCCISLGIVFGASLGLAAEVATRLAVLIVVLLLVLWLVGWATRRSVVTVQAHAEEWIGRLLDWSRHHRLLGKMGTALADPAQPETPGLAILAALLLLVGALWFALWWGLGWREYPPGLDAYVYETLQGLHTPWTTAAAVAVAQLGEWPVYLPVAAAVLVVLAWKRRKRAMAHWIAAVAFGALISLGWFALPAFPNPLEYHQGELRQHLSGRDLVLGTVIYGFVPVLLSTGRHIAWRALFYSTAVLLLTLIVLAQMYLGAQWFSMALLAVIVGAAWVAALGLGYRRHHAEPVGPQRFLPPVLAVFCLAAGLYWTAGFESHLSAATPRLPLRSLTATGWWSNDYRKLPLLRADIGRRHTPPLSLQWAGRLRDIDQTLQKAGWELSRPLTAANTLNWIAVSTPIAQLPVLPQVHAGRHQALILRRPLDDARQYVIRLWPTGYILDTGLPVWIGTVAQQQAKIFFRFLHYPVTLKDRSPQADLLAGLPGVEMRAVEFTDRGGEAGTTVWLLRPAAAPPAEPVN